MNKRFCRITHGGKAVEFAPDFLFPNPHAPTDEEYIAHGWLKNAISAPETRDGYNVSSTAYEARDGQIFAVYGYEKTPMLIPISKSAVERVIDARGKTEEFTAWLNSKAQYIGAWLRGGDTVDYDPEANDCDLLSLIAALGIPAEDIPALIESVRADHGRV